MGYARNRWYDARNATWLSEDPMLDADSPNYYAFVGYQPHAATDPFGLESRKEQLEEQIKKYTKFAYHNAFLMELNTAAGDAATIIGVTSLAVGVTSFAVSVAKMTRQLKNAVNPSTGRPGGGGYLRSKIRQQKMSVAKTQSRGKQLRARYGHLSRTQRATRIKALRAEAKAKARAKSSRTRAAAAGASASSPRPWC